MLSNSLEFYSKPFLLGEDVLSDDLVMSSSIILQVELITINIDRRTLRVLVVHLKLVS